MPTPNPAGTLGLRGGEATGLGSRDGSRMNNVGIVVESLEAAISFFGELG